MAQHANAAGSSPARIVVRKRGWVEPTRREADRRGVAAPQQARDLRLRRPDHCAVCGRPLATGEVASWDPVARSVTCLNCPRTSAQAEQDQPGASAQREYERRRARREQHAREMLRRPGLWLARLIDEPQSTRAWKQGAEGEVKTAQRLVKHLEGHGVLLLHDRRIPRRGHANIDHLAVGPGGTTVIDSKTHHGRITVEREGGLFSPRRSVLRVDGRDQTKLVDGVERQIEDVRAVLLKAGDDDVTVRGAVCFPCPDGLPILRHLEIRGVIIDGPKPIAKLARRPGRLDQGHIESLWRRLDQAFPPA